MTENLNKYIEHTLLKQDATMADLHKTFEEAKEHDFLGVCVNPCYVSEAKKCLKDTDVKVVTVIGFPLGANTTETKIFETINAVRDGADEIDMVINIGALKEGKYDYVRDEITALKKACGDKILKVIIETCLLTEEEKIRMCKIVTEAGADFIKTSTGFSSAGATREDVKLMRKNVGKNVKVKAAGGIASLDDAEDFIALGADRLGTSRVVKAVKALEQK